MTAMSKPAPKVQQTSDLIVAAQIIADSQKQVADSNCAIAEAVHLAIVRMQPLVSACNDLTLKVVALCRFLRKWTIPVLVFLVLSEILSPNATQWVHKVLVSFGILI